MKQDTVHTKPQDTGSNTQQGKYIVEIKNLQKAFGTLQVLKDVSLVVNKEENLVIMGKSGTGKSVAIKCAVRLIEPDAGSISIFGENISELNDNELTGIRKRIGFLFQSAALYDSMTVRDNLAFQLRNQKMEAGKMEALIKEALDSVGLANAIDKMPAELSGGMRKRIGLARTLITQPELVLYDEPNTGLDPITTREISQLIVELQKKNKTASIIITHDAECARITSNRIVIIDQGVIVAEGTYEELEQSEDEWVRSFFTKPD